MKNGWVEFLSGNNCLIIRNSMDFESLKNWVNYIKMTFPNKAWNQIENENQYVIFESNGSNITCSDATIDVMTAIYGKVPLESNIITQYYKAAHNEVNIDKDNLLIAYSHYTYEEFEYCVDTLPESGVLDILYTIDDDGNEVYCNYDINNECYIYSCYQDDCVLISKESASIDTVISELRNYCFSDFYSSVIENIYYKKNVVKEPLPCRELEKEM